MGKSKKIGITILVLLGVMFLMKCSKTHEEHNSNNGLKIDIRKEEFSNAKISHPGLGCEEDTFAIQIVVFENSRETKESLYKEGEDSIWDAFMNRVTNGETIKKDTTINVGNGLNDTTVYFAKFPALPVLKDSLYIYPLAGFSGSVISIYANERIVYQDKNLRMFSIPKTEIDSLGLSINSIEPIYIKVDKTYNNVEVIKDQDEITFRMVYVF